MSVASLLHPFPDDSLCLANGAEVSTKRVNVRSIEESELLLEGFVKNSEGGCLIDLEAKCHGAKAQGWDLKS